MEGHIYVYGEIISYQGDDAALFGAVSPKSVLNQIQSYPKAESFTVHINSPGGDVDAGFAIYDLLRATGKEITTLIEGQCYSIATVVSLAGDLRLATENSSFLIHNPWTEPEAGDASKIRKVADSLQIFEDKIATFYAKTTGKDVETIKAEMAKDEVMSLERALELGFLNNIIDTVKAVARINTNKNKTMSEQTEVIQAPKGFFERLTALVSGSKNNALVLKTATDEEVDFFEIEEGDPAVGDKATVNGATAEGEYLMPDGRTFKFEGGVVVEIMEPEADEMAALKEENEALKAELEGFKAQTEEINSLKETVEEIKAQAKANAATFAGLKALVSEVTVEDKKEQKQKAEAGSGSIFGDAFKNK